MSGVDDSSGTGEPAKPSDVKAPFDRPLPRRTWARREIESLEPEIFVAEADIVPFPIGWQALRSISRSKLRFGGAPKSEPAESGDPKSGQPSRKPVDVIYRPAPLGVEPVQPASPPPTTPPPQGGDNGGAGPARREVRSLRAEAPESARTGQRFTVSAQLLCGSDGLGTHSSPLRALDVPAGGRAIAIDLHVEGPLKVLSDSTTRIVILPGIDSDPVRFELEATSSGSAWLTLRAFADATVYLGQLHLALPVNDTVSSMHRTASTAPFQVAKASGRSATLEVDVNPTRQALSFRLRGPGDIGVQRPVTVPLLEAVDAIAIGLQKKLDQIVKGGYGGNDRAVEAILHTTGADLWQRVLPASVKDMLVQSLDKLDELVIIGSDDPIPWELLVPVVPRTQQAFLGDRLLVSRWAFDAPAPLSSVGGSDICYVLPESAPPAALTEIELLEASFGKGRRIATLNGLLDELDVASFGVLHFAAHNMVASDLPASAWVKLDQPFQQGMLGADRLHAFERTAPLVFMNACNSSAGSPLWVGSSGWAGRFLAAGAGAFIGSLWQVRDQSARDFAECFYTQLRDGATLGAAFQAARQVVAKPGDPSRLGYNLFGNPAATLVRQKEPARD